MTQLVLKEFPIHGVIGLILITVFWYLNWNLQGLRTHWGFFPLWLGYCLTVDAIVYYLKGDSLLSRNYRQYIALFFISVPGWWLFELFNIRMENWNYVGKEYFTDLEFFLLASISFSTVMPAVFSTAELMNIFFKKKDVSNNKKPTDKQLIAILRTGLLIVILIILLPQYFYFLIWVALYFILDPLNVWLGRPNLLSNFINKDYRPLFILGAGALTCGFFWEMWNYYSYPKWEYYLPMVNFLHVFEMPVLGYIGYVPFALELFALYSLISGKDLIKEWDGSGYRVV